MNLPSIRTFRRPLLAALLILVAAAGIAPAQAPSGWQTYVLPGHDLGKAPLYLDRRWNGGVLRVRLKAAATLPESAGREYQLKGIDAPAKLWAA